MITKKTPQQIEIESIITGDIDFNIKGTLFTTSIINYTDVNSDYDGIVLREIVNHIGWIGMN
jgi:hypothetical protein